MFHISHVHATIVTSSSFGTLPTKRKDHGEEETYTTNENFKSQCCHLDCDVLDLYDYNKFKSVSKLYNSSCSKMCLLNSTFLTSNAVSANDTHCAYLPALIPLCLRLQWVSFLEQTLITADLIPVSGMMPRSATHAINDAILFNFTETQMSKKQKQKSVIGISGWIVVVSIAFSVFFKTLFSWKSVENACFQLFQLKFQCFKNLLWNFLLQNSFTLITFCR